MVRGVYTPNVENKCDCFYTNIGYHCKDTLYSKI